MPLSLRTCCGKAGAAGLLLWATTAHAADLLAIYRQAKTHDAVYAMANSTLTAAREKLPQGRALLLPSVSATANSNYNDRDIDFRDGTRSAARYNANAYGVSVTMPVVRMQNVAQFDQARSQVEQAQLQFAAATQDLALRTAQAYFDVLLARDNVRLAGAQVQAYQRQLEQAKQQFRLGSGSMTDIREAEARNDLAAAQAIAADNELDIKRQALELIVKAVPTTLASLKSPLPLQPPDPDNMSAWIDQALAANPQVLAQRAASAIAEQEVRKNRYGHYPTLDAVASYTNAGNGSGIQGGIGNDTVTKTVGLQLAVPLYQGGSVTSRVREAVAQHTRSRQELDSVMRQVTLTARQAFLGVRTGMAQIRALEAAIASAESQLEATRLGREVGLRTSVDILNAQQQLFQVQRDVAQARYAYVMSQLRLSAAVGKLGEDDLATFNVLLTTAEAPAKPANPRTSEPPAATPAPALAPSTGPHAEPEPGTALVRAPALVLTPALELASAAVEPAATPSLARDPPRVAPHNRLASCKTGCNRRSPR
jgi:outer membrane protein